LADAIADDRQFPKWVWYTHRENHEETKLLSAKQKEKLIKTLDVPK
jgi:hypothetical protein